MNTSPSFQICNSSNNLSTTTASGSNSQFGTSKQNSNFSVPLPKQKNINNDSASAQVPSTNSIATPNKASVHHTILCRWALKSEVRRAVCEWQYRPQWIWHHGSSTSTDGNHTRSLWWYDIKFGNYLRGDGMWMDGRRQKSVLRVSTRVGSVGGSTRRRTNKAEGKSPRKGDIAPALWRMAGQKHPTRQNNPAPTPHSYPPPLPHPHPLQRRPRSIRCPCHHPLYPHTNPA